jgi:hypothetical protein
MPGQIVIGNRQIRAAACETALACQLPQEFLLVHVVLEGFPAIDEDDWDLIVELPAKFRVRVNVNPPRRESLDKLSLTTSHRWQPLRE